ncbi:MAG: hypothetical protein HW416_182 [Chloroflexi bacterium]|nr:hypothetical protein [Chloroflexota bacterium]
MLGFLKRDGNSSEDRAEIIEYLAKVRPLAEAAEREFAAWMAAVVHEPGADPPRANSPRLAIEADPEGRHASIYLWHVGDPARDFVECEPTKPTRAYYEAFSLCLEARAAAADGFRSAAEGIGARDPAPQIAQANRKLAEADHEHARATAAMAALEARAG